MGLEGALWGADCVKMNQNRGVYKCAWGYIYYHGGIINVDGDIYTPMRV